MSNGIVFCGNGVVKRGVGYIAKIEIRDTLWNELNNPQDTSHERIYDRLKELCVPVKLSGRAIGA